MWPDAACPSARTRNIMRSPSQRSSSTCSTGMLEAARVSPAFRRRVASARPSRCGIETMSGVDISQIPVLIQLHLIARGSKGRAGPTLAIQKWNFTSSRLFFRLKAEQQTPTAGLEEILNVDWNDHSYYSRYRPARRLQRHRGGGRFFDRVFLWGGGGVFLFVF